MVVESLIALNECKLRGCLIKSLQLRQHHSQSSKHRDHTCAMGIYCRNKTSKIMYLPLRIQVAEISVYLNLYFPCIQKQVLLQVSMLLEKDFLCYTRDNAVILSYHSDFSSKNQQCSWSKYQSQSQYCFHVFFCSECFWVVVDLIRKS